MRWQNRDGCGIKHAPIQLELLVQELLDVWIDDFAFGALKLGQHALLPKEVENGPRLVGEHLEAIADRLRLVVLPLDERLSGDVVLALDLGRAEHQVVDPARAGVDEAILDAVNDGLEGHVQMDHDVDRRLALDFDGRRDGARIKPT